MTNSGKRLGWATARIEVAALMPEIDIYLADSITRSAIYKTLKDQGKLSCGFSTFCRWVDRLSDQHPVKAKPSAVTKSADQSKPLPSSSKSSPKKKSSPTAGKSKPAESSGLRVVDTPMPKFTLDDK